MDDELKARFRQFAERWRDDETVDDSGLTGRDLKVIAARLERLVAVRYASLDELAAMTK
ncbi:hypothetical protein [Sphingobium sp. DC-2]|uniref:hypothetical protein n=1 Tax=Sphingobium sp. DC-2 TaxID=1303256 RepID=UPI000AD133C2|nr:hypothetical protein [Sphingobium sp. DC-2]